jgi:hypothetical protein
MPKFRKGLARGGDGNKADYGGLRQVTVNYGGKLFSAAVRALAIRGGKDGANKPKST